MELETATNWIVQPDVCRCCLSACGGWDMTVSYFNEQGKSEIYSQIFQECFGITLECTKDCNNWSSMICENCVGHLRSAVSFRSQVLDAQERLLLYYGKQGSLEAEVKLEIEEYPCIEETHILPDNYDDGNSDTNHLDSQTNSPEPNNIKAERKIKKPKLRRKRTDTVDSDIPISKLTNDYRTDCHENKTEIVLTEKCELDEKQEKVVLINEDVFSEDALLKGPHQMSPVKHVKSISESKRIQLTCAVILQYTTACPFRHRKSWFQCFYCHDDFMAISPLREHTRTIHTNVEAELKKIKRYPRSLQIDISDLKCKICSVALDNVLVMIQHFKEVHSKEIYKESIADFKVNSSPYNCHLCGQQFHVFRTLTTHLNEHYANCICDVCGKSFINSKRLKVHKRTHESGHYPCAECGKVLNTKTSHINHMQSAHSKRGLKCQVCLLPMKHYNERVKHMSEAHNITHTFKCTICSREYNIKHYLATHMRQTHGHKDKKCQECGMAFITNHGLKKHMLKHSGEKPHLCRVCNKSYARSYTLKEHMRAHETTGTFVCQQ